MRNFLLIDDEASWAERLQSIFPLENATIEHQPDSQKCLDLDASVLAGYTALIVDLYMPAIDGLALIYRMRERFGKIPPTFLLSCEESEKFRLAALRLGAVDYLYKTMSPEEIGLRIENSLRLVAVSVPSSSLVRHLGLELDSLNLRLNSLSSLGGAPVELTQIESRILHHLFAQGGAVIARDSLVSFVWREAKITAGSLHSHLYNLNKKIALFGWKVSVDRRREVSLIKLS